MQPGQLILAPADLERTCPPGHPHAESPTWKVVIRGPIPSIFGGCENRVDSMNIGFIGLGSMGARIVNLLIDGGHNLILWARRPDSLRPFAGRADFASSPGEVARASDMVGICVWGADDVEEVVLGENGVLSGARPGTVIAIHSTISPAACRLLGVKTAAADTYLIDAAVSVGANLPKLLMMVGGDRPVVDRCRPGLEAVADPLLHLGPLGSGQMAKLVNNTLLAATIGLADDAIALGADLGLDAEALGTALAAGSARGTWSSFVNRPRPTVEEPSARFATEWARKDVGYAMSVVVEAGLETDRDVLRLARRGAEVVG